MNAANNPFRSGRVTALPYLPQESTWEELIAALEALNWRGAVVGPCGTGKTTLLEELAPQLEERGLKIHFYRLDSSAKRLQSSFWNQNWDPRDALLLDGAEQLPRWNWQAVKRKTRVCGAFVVTSHQEGLLPTWVRSQTSPALLNHLCEQLGVSLPSSELQELFTREKGNIRLCLMELYDRAGEIFEPGS